MGELLNPFFVAFPFTFSKYELLNLSCSGLRKIAKLDIFRGFEAGYPVLTEVDDLVFG